MVNTFKKKVLRFYYGEFITHQNKLTYLHLLIHIEHLIAEHINKVKKIKNDAKSQPPSPNQISPPHFLFIPCFKQIFSIPLNYAKFHRFHPPGLTQFQFHNMINEYHHFFLIFT